MSPMHQALHSCRMFLDVLRDLVAGVQAQSARPVAFPGRWMLKPARNPGVPLALIGQQATSCTAHGCTIGFHAYMRITRGFRGRSRLSLH
jgi:hypothetical protein